MKSQISWSEENKKILYNVYPTGGTEGVRNLIPNASIESIKSAARRFGIKYDTQLNYKNKLKPLLAETNFNYYWIGFIMADGSWNLTGNTNLSIKISNTDKDHLAILSNYLKVKLHTGHTQNFDKYTCNDNCYINVSDSINTFVIFDKFKLKPRKTENPPDLRCLNTKEKFLSFFIGFVDGDGCITEKNGRANMIRIQCHKNWLNNLNFISLKLNKYLNIKSKTIIDNQGYCKFVIHSFNDLKKIKKETISLNIPFLLRKWNKINHLMSDVFIIDNFEHEFIQHYNNGLNYNEIAKKFNCSLAPIYRMKKKLKLSKRYKN